MTNCGQKRKHSLHYYCKINISARQTLLYIFNKINRYNIIKFINKCLAVLRPDCH
ncbi:hypothetical protein BACCAP_01414 [Pseudoflavonifractor capillosus ATCC 29799]|uniref:Uncharacterized protein n=1 Tax=Pseudoflavonifractor capillosus ATCC 29799 TaxID=411467 RepID=A6NT85_9FIRM|nr:hypothetical protein BACCAP_01414 [Pseudoflavonifractor capillosus ATCC 29799]